MNNNAPEALLKSLGSTNMKYYTKTIMAVQKAMEPYHNATMVMQKAMEPQRKASMALQKAMEPISATQQIIQELSAPSRAIKELISQTSNFHAFTVQSSLSPAMPSFSAVLSSQMSKSFRVDNITHLLSKESMSGLEPIVKTPCFPSLAQHQEVQQLVQTINTFDPNDDIFLSEVKEEILNSDIHIDTVDISEELAHNISSVLKDKDIFVESVSSKKSKTVCIDAFKKYLIIFMYWLPVITFVYNLGHDYLSDKATAEFQYKMLEEEHNQTIEERKQTKLLQDIDDKLSQSNSVISKEKY